MKATGIMILLPSRRPRFKGVYASIGGSPGSAGKVKILWSNFANCRPRSLDIFMFFERISFLYAEKGLKYLICEREWM